MKLRNKQTGEIGELKPFVIDEKIAVWVENKSHPNYRYNSLAELNDDWEDYEEPKQWYGLNAIRDVGFEPLEYEGFEDLYKHAKELGIAFETEEEAEKAVEKLKAWTRLKDLGTEILGWETRDMPTGGDWQTVNVKLNIKARKEPMELLDLLFEGEE